MGPSDEGEKSWNKIAPSGAALTPPSSRGRQSTGVNRSPSAFFLLCSGRHLTYSEEDNHVGEYRSLRRGEPPPSAWRQVTWVNRARMR
jgi:hypothetical protein